MEPIWLFKMFIAHFHPLLFYRIKSLVFPVPCHQTTILRTQRPYFHKMTTALVEALYLKLFEIQCFPAFSISSYWYYYLTIQHLFGVTGSIKKEASSLFTHYWLPILLILFTSLHLRQVFILNITSVFPPAFYIPPNSNIYQLHE